jgi:hypothetical protein
MEYDRYGKNYEILKPDQLLHTHTKTRTDLILTILKTIITTQILKIIYSEHWLDTDKMKNGVSDTGTGFPKKCCSLAEASSGQCCFDGSQQGIFKLKI